MVTQACGDQMREVTALARQLWPEHDFEALYDELCALLKEGNAAFFLALDGQSAVGFAQCQLRRDYVEGTRSSPVGYLEGVYVKEAYRKKGYARQLLESCEEWARRHGCTEFASDCELDNETSLRFHLSVGFEEANRIVCFTKTLCAAPDCPETPRDDEA